ncbi:hypothetical protein IAT40_005385 [Kwoniella sp. CBS 6097]
MLETVVGQLPARKLEYSYSDTPFIDTVIFSNSNNTNTASDHGRSSFESGTQRQVISRQGQRRTDPHRERERERERGRSKEREREDLESEDEGEFISAGEEGGGEELDMGELSDSPSSVHTSSRPVTPSHPAPHPLPGAIHIPRVAGSGPGSKLTNSGSPSNNSPPSVNGPSANEGVFTLAHKAEKILGLVPGTLGHARACLENARDEVRRTAESKSPTPEPPFPGYSFSGPNPTAFASASAYSNGNGNNGNPSAPAPAPAPAPGMRDRIQTRARKAMSVAGFPGYSYNGSSFNGSSKMNGVVVGIGGKEEEERRERRRKAADGVLYWQREVARLEKEAEAAMGGGSKR